MLESAATANASNVLSALVTAHVRDADSVRIRYRLSGTPSSADSVTPAVAVAGDTTVLPLLGLLPGSRYEVRVEVSNRRARALGAVLSVTTGQLPDDLPRFEASGPDASPGFVVLAAGMYGLVIDNTGRVVWYHRFPHGPGLNFVALSNGHFAARPMMSDPATIGPWVVLDVLGREVAQVTCALGLRPRLHELRVGDDGSHWLLCDETRVMDLTAHGGVSAARVMGTAIQQIGRDGALLFHWSPFDHLAITDLDSTARLGPSVNWTHANAIDFDDDGHLVVSFRSLNEITKIDRRTGAVLWRMGGRRNQFSFTNTDVPAFSGQHSARFCANGELLLLDNYGNPLETRAERYALDQARRTARLVHSYGSAGRALTMVGGSVQPLPGDRTLVSFGTAGRVEEYDATGRLRWQINGHAGYVFRAQRIASLYAPGMQSAR